jgi:hypothetical protein
MLKLGKQDLQVFKIFGILIAKSGSCIHLVHPENHVLPDFQPALAWIQIVNLRHRNILMEIYLNDFHSNFFQMVNHGFKSHLNRFPILKQKRLPVSGQPFDMI